MLDWEELIPQDGGVVILWRSPEAPSGLGLRVLGWPKKELIEYEGIWLTFRSLTQSHDTADLVQLSAYKEPPFDDRDNLIRSEERRVGKECRSTWQSDVSDKY